MQNIVIKKLRKVEIITITDLCGLDFNSGTKGGSKIDKLYSSLTLASICVSNWLSIRFCIDILISF